MADFDADLSEFVRKAKRRLVVFYINLGQMALARVKELTPVKTGNLRANWQLVVGDAAQPVAGPPPLTMALGEVLTVVNPVSYARRIEYGFQGTDAKGRTYHQEGRHMLQQTFTEMPEIARKALAEARKVA